MLTLTSIPRSIFPDSNLGLTTTPEKGYNHRVFIPESLYKRQYKKMLTV